MMVGLEQSPGAALTDPANIPIPATPSTALANNDVLSFQRLGRLSSLNSANTEPPLVFRVCPVTRGRFHIHITATFSAGLF